MTSPVAMAVFGASGRMGRAVLRLAEPRADIDIVAAIVREQSSAHGEPVSHAPSARRFNSVFDGAEDLDVIVDFSGATGFDGALAAALDRGVALVSGSTGLDADQLAALEQAATRIPVLWTANFSVGVAVLRKLVREAARALPDFDCEIVEAHHRHKKDAPSGTALALGTAVAHGRGVDFDSHAVLARSPQHGTRRDGEIGFSVLRGGDIVGEHSVLLIGDGERIELSHRATDRDIFARGAITAALWLAGKPPGRYSLDDVLA